MCGFVTVIMCGSYNKNDVLLCLLVTNSGIYTLPANPASQTLKHLWRSLQHNLG